MKRFERSDDFGPVQEAARQDELEGVRTEEQGLEGLRALRKSIRKCELVRENEVKVPPVFSFLS